MNVKSERMLVVQLEGKMMRLGTVPWADCVCPNHQIFGGEGVFLRHLSHPSHPSLS